MRTCVKLSPVHSTAPQALFLLHLPGSAPLCRESHLCPLSCIPRLQCSSHPPPRSTSLHGPQLSSFSPYSLCSNFAHSLPSQPERRFTEPYSSPFPTTPTSPSRSLLAAGQRLSLPFFPAPIERTTALRPVALQVPHPDPPFLGCHTLSTWARQEAGHAVPHRPSSMWPDVRKH